MVGTWRSMAVRSKMVRGTTVFAMGEEDGHGFRMALLVISMAIFLDEQRDV